jgi:hypothetical protein
MTRAGTLAAALWGAVLFLWFAGWKILNPTDIGWLMPYGDPSQHYLGWAFFRHTPLLQFPLGANHAFGEAISSSIVFSDSVPLMAFLLKPFSALLPATFQYLGPWMMLCFVLQAVFAYKLVARFIEGLMPCLLIVGLFTLSPVMMWRLLGHEALLAHWLILAALNVYFDSAGKMWKWVILVVIAAAVHAYLAAMVCAIFLFDLIHQAVIGERARQLVLRFLTVFAILGLWMWAVGYFYPNSVQAGGFGYFQFRLLNFFRPLDMWSSVLPLVPYNDYVAGGFMYLGLGGIGLLICAAVALAVRRGLPPVDRATVLPLVALSVGLLIYGVSNKIIAWDDVLLSYPLPHFAESLTSTFRVSGRFVWPVTYLLLLGCAIVVTKTFRKGVVVAIFATLLIAQGNDMLYPRKVFVSYWSGTWNSPLVSAFWEDRAQRYDRIEIVLPSDQPQNDLPISVFASQHGMTVNSGYLARVSPEKLQLLRNQVTEAIKAGQFRSDTLYVFIDETLFELAKQHAPAGAFVGVIDGYRVMAP